MAFYNLISSPLLSLRNLTPLVAQVSKIHVLNRSLLPNEGIVSKLWSLTSVRTSIRYHFPRPNENKRIKKHGWWKRINTPGGRKILMRRILKGRHVLSH